MSRIQIPTGTMDTNRQRFIQAWRTKYVHYTFTFYFTNTIQTSRRVPLREFQSLSPQSAPMPRSDSISSVSSFSSTQSSPLFPTQEWQTIAGPHVLPSYAAPSESPRGQPVEFRRPIPEPQHVDVSPLPDRRNRKVTERRDRREKSKGRAYCQLCDKDFARPADVNRHVRTVS